MDSASKLTILCLSFYNLDYGIGASAALLDQLVSLPTGTDVVVIEPKRIDLPSVKIELPNSMHRIIVPLPFWGFFSLIYPYFAFLYGFKAASKFNPQIIFSMHHPHHCLSLVGHLISKILKIHHIVDVHDVLQPSKRKRSLTGVLLDLFEQTIIKHVKDDILIFVCSEMKEILEFRSGIKFENALILTNCVPDLFIKDIKTKKRVTSKVLNFVFVGRVGQLYGLGKIKPLFDALYSLGYMPRLFVVGHDQTELPEFAKFLGGLSRRRTLQFIAECDIGIGPLNPILSIPKKIVEYLVLDKVLVVSKGVVSKDILSKFSDRILELTDETESVIYAHKLLYMLKNEATNKDKTYLFCSTRWKTILDELKDKHL